MNPIVALTGLELECTSLDETIQWYTNLFGLQVWSRNPQRITFKGTGHEKHQLTFVAGTRNRLTGLRLGLNPLDTLEAFSERIASNGISVSRLTETSVAFDDPDVNDGALLRLNSITADDLICCPFTACQRTVHSSPLAGHVCMFTGEKNCVAKGPRQVA